MKIGHVVVAVNENKAYTDFIRIFIRAYQKLYKNIKIHIIYIAAEIPKDLQDVAEHLVLFKALPGVHTAYQAQVIRILYPCLIPSKDEGVLITDMDMIPLSSTFFEKAIKSIAPNKFVCYRDILRREKQLPICYNVATQSVWKEIFHIDSLSDLKTTLIKWYSNIQYSGQKGNPGWTTDQCKLYSCVMEWNKTTNRFIGLNDNKTGYRRMKRSQPKINLNIKQQQLIKTGYYSDYHMHTPYIRHHDFINKIVDLL